MKILLKPFARIFISLLAVVLISVLCSAIVNENTDNSNVNWLELCTSKLVWIILIIVILISIYNFYGFSADRKEKEADEDRLIEKIKAIGLINKAQNAINKVETGDGKLLDEFKEEDNGDEN